MTSRSFSPHVVLLTNDPGSVDETVTCTLNATNDCGGGETRTVALHIVGTIEPGALAMSSVYFSTDVPTNLKSDAGLLPSEQEELKTVAEEFKKYLAYKSDARLILAGHADRRGPDSYNQLLSERRAEIVKRFLVEQGVPESSIDVQVFGKKDNLTTEQVEQLLNQSTDLTGEMRERASPEEASAALFAARADVQDKFLSMLASTEGN